MLVGVCGSRHLPPGASYAIANRVAELLASGHDIVTGCALGTDSAAIGAALGLNRPHQLTVMAAFGRRGTGAIPGCSSPAAVAAAAAAGANVQYWTGGRPPTIPARARLARRSLAMLRYLLNDGGALLACPNSSPPPWLGPGRQWQTTGSGTWSAIAWAAGNDLPVYLLPLAGCRDLSLEPGLLKIQTGLFNGLLKFRTVCMRLNALTD